LETITTLKIVIKVIRTLKKKKDQNIEKPKITTSKRTSKVIINLKITFNVVIILNAIGKIKSLGSFSTLKPFRRSDFTYGVKKDHNVENQKYIFKQLPMVYYLWLQRPVGPWGG
jgi:hypothetical protein